MKLKVAAVLALLATLSIPSLATNQDGAWWGETRRFAESKNWEGVASARRMLRSVDDNQNAGVIIAVRSILLECEKLGKGGKKWLKELAKYFKKVGARPTDVAGHKKALAVAMGAGGFVGDYLTLGHIDQLLRLGVSPRDMEKVFKKRKISLFGENVATPEGSILARIREIKDGNEVARLTSSSRSMSLKYYTAVALMQSISKEDKSPAERAIEALTPLSRWSIQHVKLMITTLETIVACGSCNDKQKIRCYACKGRRSRRLVCEICDGKGTIPWDVRTPKPEKRKEIDARRGYPEGRSYCPSCVGNTIHKVRTAECTFCEQKGWVECQRCKYMKVDFDLVGTVLKCVNCKETGMMFEKVRHPCAFCHGLGYFVEPTADASITVGPTE